MQVFRFEAVGVAQMNHSSRSALRPGFDDDAVGDGDNGRSHRRAVIDAEVRAIFAENRMQPAPRKPRRHHGNELERRLQEETPERNAALVEVARASTVGSKSERAERAST